MYLAKIIFFLYLKLILLAKSELKFMEISLTWIVQEIGLNQQIDMHFPKLRSRKVQYLGGEVAKELKCRKNFIRKLHS